MPIIENFADIPAKEQISFATALIKTINSEKTFSDDVQFELVGVEPDDLTGGFVVKVSHDKSIAVARKATWTCDTEEDAEDVPADFEADFDNYLLDDAKKAFKTLSTTIEGYQVSLEVADADEDDSLDPEAEVENIRHEDAGIGDYEYFGFKGHDSRPYVEVDGIITKYYECAIALYVEPTQPEEEPTSEAEEV